MSHGQWVVLLGMLALAGCGGGASNPAAATAAAASAPAIALAPTEAQLSYGAAQTFTAAISGTPGTPAWSATGGTLLVDGDQAAFTAGTQSGSFQVEANLASGVSASATVSVSPPTFTAPAAAWLYAAPAGAPLDISAAAAGLAVGVNAHDGGFDFPVQYTDGSNGCISFTDTAVYSFYNDDICAPEPTGGFAPSLGAYGDDDGHLIVVDTASGDYFDFWKLQVDANGQPTSTNIGQIVTGSLAAGNGTPGTTAAGISGFAGDILPGELDCENCLGHALAVIVPAAMNSNLVGTQAPAEKTDGTVAGAVFREGAKIGLDPAVDVDALDASTAAKAILLALQRYGGVIVDQTGASGIYCYSALSTSPDLTGLDTLTQHLFIYY